MYKTFIWITDNANNAVIALERCDDRDNSLSYAMVTNNKLDKMFRDDNGELKGIVSEKHLREFQVWMNSTKGAKQYG
jgi:hypothetical protein